MGRPRSYDPEAVLDAAQGAFWRRGYEATSVAELCSVTGLEKGSLYHAFGDKKALFLRVLDRYLSSGVAGLHSLMDGEDDVVEGVGIWFEAAVASCTADGAQRGCLGLNSLVELGPHDNAIAERIQAHLSDIDDVLVGLLTAGQAAGHVRTDRPAADLASYVQTVMGGISATSRGGSADWTATIGLLQDTLRGG